MAKLIEMSLIFVLLRKKSFEIVTTRNLSTLFRRYLNPHTFKSNVRKKILSAKTSFKGLDSPNLSLNELYSLIFALKIS